MTEGQFKKMIERTISAQRKANRLRIELEKEYERRYDVVPNGDQWVDLVHMAVSPSKRTGQAEIDATFDILTAEAELLSGNRPRMDIPDMGNS